MKTPRPNASHLKLHTKRMAALSQRLWWAVPIGEEARPLCIENADASEALARFALSMTDWMDGAGTESAWNERFTKADESITALQAALNARYRSAKERKEAQARADAAEALGF